MAFPTVGDELFEELGRTQPGDADRGGPFRTFLNAVGAIFGVLPELLRDTDTGPGWSLLLDVDRIPAPWVAWLGQFAGVAVTDGADATQQRAEVRNGAGFRRGTPPAMRAAMLAVIPGPTPVVSLFERDGSPYRLTAVAYKAQLVANYATNPSSEVTKASSDTADYTVTREASGTGGVPAFVGGWRDKHAFDGSASDSNTGFFSLTFPAAGTYVVSRYVWLPAAWTGGALRITSDTNYTGATETILKAADLTLRDQWQRISTKITVAAGDLAGFFGVRTSSPPSSSGTGVFYTDARQVERGATPTDYVDGHMTGYLFTGAADASTTQRDPAVVQAAALSQKPGGLVLTYRTDQGWSYGQAEAAFATYTTAQAAYATYDPAESQLPS